MYDLTSSWNRTSKEYATWRWPEWPAWRLVWDGDSSSPDIPTSTGMIQRCLACPTWLMIILVYRHGANLDLVWYIFFSSFLSSSTHLSSPADKILTAPCVELLERCSHKECLARAAEKTKLVLAIRTFVIFQPVRLLVSGLSANEQYFSLKPNQPTVLSVMTYKSNQPKQTGQLTEHVSN